MVLNIKNFQLNYRQSTYDCVAPCSLYSVLLGNNVIEDPYFGENETKYVDIARHDCEFVSVFDIDKQLLDNERVELRLLGVDTLVDVYFNGRLLGKCNNMHRTWVFDIKSVATEKDNKLQLYFHSPLNFTDECEKINKIYAPDCSYPGYGHLRKTYCSYGWDWGPVIPDSCIYRDVLIVGNSDGEIDNVLSQVSLQDDKAVVNVKTAVKYSKDHSVKCKLTSPDGQEFTAAGEDCSIAVENPELWWPNGMGKQPLYKLTVELFDNGKLVDTRVLNVGLRTLTVSTEKDKWGSEFCFVVNGKKFFAMGADYIPEDAFITRMNDERTEKLLQACADANHNTIRVWGGGFYPSESFYDTCDRLGLVVWQDFMFACSTFTFQSVALDNILAEAKDVLLRVRNHACLGLMCGNNELEVAWEQWGIPKSAIDQFCDYLTLFEKELPKLCSQLASSTFYWPCSPSSGGKAINPGNQNVGDVHCWEVWHGSEPFTFYRNRYFRFCSEYGYEAFPSLKTLKTICDDSQLNAFSPIMESHQKCKGGNTKIFSKLSDYFYCPENFEDLIFASQIMQAEAIRYGAEHFRRNRGRCMGSIYWQLNDNWQTASWSSIDYFGRWKALHYYSKRFYAPVSLTAEDDGYVVKFNVDNNTLHDVKGYVRYRVVDVKGNAVQKGKISLKSCALTSTYTKAIDFSEIIKGNERNYALLFDYVVDGKTVSSGDLFFVKYKFFHYERPKMSYKFTKQGDDVTLTISASNLINCLQIDFDDFDVQLSDNCFTMCNEKRVVTFKTDKSVKQLKNSVRFNCINELNRVK